MNTFKNSEIAREYNVSDPTVLNWINSAIEGKNNLQLFKVNDKLKIVNNEHNKAELSRLSEIGFNYKNKILKSDISPDQELYDTLTTTQIIELINEIKINKLIPLKFTYLNGGAELWDNYVNEGLKNGTYVVSEITDKLVSQSLDFLINKSSKFKKVNIVDIGSGNAYPLKNLLTQLSKDGLLNKYITIDISPNLSQIANNNVRSWLPDIDLATFTVDFEKGDLSEILFEIKNTDDVVNIIFFVGGTFGNLEDKSQFLKIIKQSLDNEDVFAISNKINKKKSYADLGHLTGMYQSLLWIPKLLGIETDKCEIVGRYETELESRALFLKPDKDYSIQFDIKGTRKSIQIFKGDEIRLWKHHMTTVGEMVSDLSLANLELIHYTTTPNLTDGLFVCKPKVLS
jgi:uncharacterized SAM-dependent methyltransferase